MGVQGNKKIASILLSLNRPVLTIFEDDVKEWVDVVSAELARKVYEMEKKNLPNYVIKEDYDKLIDVIFEETSKVMKEFERKFPENLRLVIVKGRFGIGEKRCIVTDVISFSTDALIDVGRKVFRTLVDSVNGKTEIRRLKERSAKTNLEYTLEQYIPALGKKDLEEWSYEISTRIVEKIYSGEWNLENTRQIAKELLSEEIEKILRRLEELGNRYITIVDKLWESAATREENCQILTVSDFLDKLYKLSYNNILQTLNRGRKDEN
jgi:hypothetical protein